MKIASRPSKPDLEMVDCRTVDLVLDINPTANVHMLTVTVMVEVPPDIAYDYDKFAEFIKDVKNNVKVVR